MGTVIGASLAAPIAASPAGAFLKDVNRSILLAAGVVALALGALLFSQLTSPIRQLTAAAPAISAGARSCVRGLSLGSLLARSTRWPQTWPRRKGNAKDAVIAVMQATLKAGPYRTKVVVRW